MSLDSFIADPGNAQEWSFDFMPPGRRIDLN